MKYRRRGIFKSIGNLKTAASERNIKNGSITVYLSMSLCVILSLIFVCMYSARTAAARAAVSCAADQGMFSLFSNYDRTLYDKFGLLFLDSGYGTGELNLGIAAAEATEYTKKALSPTAGILMTTPESLYDISIDSAAVTGYTLATDSGYAPLIEQICEVMKLKLGADGINKLKDALGVNASAIEEFGLESEDEINELEKKYEENKELAERLKSETQGDEETENTDLSVRTDNVEVPSDFKNPVDNITELRKLGLMSFALPEGASVSEAAVDLNDMLSRRNLNMGMGLLPEKKSGLDTKLLISAFAADMLDGYLTAEDGDFLQYRTEYVICGKSSDAANLKGVMEKLTLIRTGLNYIHIMSDAEKSAQAYEIALIISAILLAPEAVDAVAQTVKLLWAYAESMMDVKNLLDGGKVPIFKDKSSWQVSLDLFSIMDTQTKPQKQTNGLDYNDYLKIFLYMLPEDTLYSRTVDMIEYTKRTQDDYGNFRLDCCLSELEIEISCHAASRELTVDRKYGYSAQ